VNSKEMKLYKKKRGMVEVLQ